jgi:selenium-binding protein 1
MFDGLVYLIDTTNGTSKVVFDCETIVPHIEVPVRGGMTQLLAMPRSGDRLIFASFQAGQVGMLDISDPEHPVQTGIVNLGVDAGPHMTALTDDDKRLVVSDYFLNEDDFGKIHFEGITTFTSLRSPKIALRSTLASTSISTPRSPQGRRGHTGWR